jgi:hypothetical protein
MGPSGAPWRWFSLAGGTSAGERPSGTRSKGQFAGDRPSPSPGSTSGGTSTILAGVTFLSCCLQGLEQSRSYNPDVAHLTLVALALAAIGTLASGAAAVWARFR